MEQLTLAIPNSPYTTPSAVCRLTTLPEFGDSQRLPEKSTLRHKKAPPGGGACNTGKQRYCFLNFIVVPSLVMVSVLPLTVTVSDTPVLLLVNVTLSPLIV